MAKAWKEPPPTPGTQAVVVENVTRAKPRPSHKRRLMPVAVLSVALVIGAGIVAWLLLHNGESTASGPTPQAATIVSQAQLEQVAAAVDHPVYWAGPKPGYSYELTTSSNGRFYVRYLPPGVNAGDPRPNFLVVGTYTQPGSYEALEKAAKHGGTATLPIPDGGIALVSSRAPSNVYFTYPEAKYQVEVYDPSGDHARKLALGGHIVPIR